MDEKLQELAVYQYYSALAAGLPPKGISGLLKDGTMVSAGPVSYTNGHFELAEEAFDDAMKVGYYKTHPEGGLLPPINEVLDKKVVVEPDPENIRPYIVNFQMEP